MATRSYIKDDKGNITAVRETEDGGKKSIDYEYSLNPFSECGEPISTNIHDGDKTTSYEHTYIPGRNNMGKKK